LFNAQTNFIHFRKRKSSAMPRVYVGHIPYEARERDVERFFKGYGKIRDILMKRGYCFVELSDDRDADDAVYDLNGKSLMGMRVVVEIAKGKPRGGGGDRYGGGRSGGGRRSRSRSRSPRRSSKRSRSRSPRDRSRSPRKSRSASRSPSPVDRKRSRSDSPPPRKDSRSASPAANGNGKDRSASPASRSPSHD